MNVISKRLPQYEQEPGINDLQYLATLRPDCGLGSFEVDNRLPLSERVSGHLEYTARALVAASLAQLHVADEKVAAVAAGEVELYRPVVEGARIPVVGARSESLVAMTRYAPVSPASLAIWDSVRLAALAPVVRQFGDRFPFGPALDPSFSETAVAAVGPEAAIPLSTFKEVNRMTRMELLAVQDTAQVTGVVSATCSRLRMQAETDSADHGLEHVDLTLQSVETPDMTQVEVTLGHRRFHQTDSEAVPVPTRFNGGELISYFAQAAYAVTRQ